MSELAVQLFESGAFGEAIWATVYMTVLSTAIAYLFGLPLGTLLYATDRGGVMQCLWLNRVAGTLVNLVRSIPFIVVMFAFLPLARKRPRLVTERASVAERRRQRAKRGFTMCGMCIST